MSAQTDCNVPYFAPPDGFESITRDGCAQCGRIIRLGPVVGGFKWQHVADSTDHEVVIPRPWWDTREGRFRTEVFVEDQQATEPPS